MNVWILGKFMFYFKALMKCGFWEWRIKSCSLQIFSCFVLHCSKPATQLPKFQCLSGHWFPLFPFYCPRPKVSQSHVGPLVTYFFPFTPRRQGFQEDEGVISSMHCMKGKQRDSAPTTSEFSNLLALSSSLIHSATCLLHSGFIFSKKSVFFSHLAKTALSIPGLLDRTWCVWTINGNKVHLSPFSQDSWTSCKIRNTDDICFQGSWIFCKGQ